VNIRKTFTLMSIIQNMVQYYITQTFNVSPWKPKILQLTNTEKTVSNGITIHFVLPILLNKYKQTKIFKQCKKNILIKTYNELHSLIIDEILLV
jgi:uncharacterized membrane protein